MFRIYVRPQTGKQSRCHEFLVFLTAVNQRCDQCHIYCSFLILCNSLSTQYNAVQRNRDGKCLLREQRWGKDLEMRLYVVLALKLLTRLVYMRTSRLGGDKVSSEYKGCLYLYSHVPPVPRKVSTWEPHKGILFFFVPHNQSELATMVVATPVRSISGGRIRVFQLKPVSLEKAPESPAHHLWTHIGNLQSHINLRRTVRGLIYRAVSSWRSSYLGQEYEVQQMNTLIKPFRAAKCGCM